jgi:ketosteroid isomerase-like protein
VPWLPLITRYYDACSAGDLDELRATLHPDVVHYFLAPNVGSAPVRGGEHLTRYWRKVSENLDATWVVDHILEAEISAVIEWTMWWQPQGSSQRVATRGSEWFEFADGRIVEIRAYYQQLPSTTELEGFPYETRGYSVAASRTVRDW